MIIPDFCDRSYTAEVMRTRTDPAEAVKAISRLTRAHDAETQGSGENQSVVNVLHRHYESGRTYHRSPERSVRRGDQEIMIPRTRVRARKTLTLYDVFIAQCDHHIVVAVPFHDLAEHLFIRVDRELAGTRTVYEKLDITKMVIKLGARGATKVPANSSDPISISVTRCHLTYMDKERRPANINQIQMNGVNLGASDEYKSLIAPVLSSGNSAATVTPVVLGFALSANDVKKTSATTDRHGNFKLWMGPGVRRLFRLFDLLRVIEGLENVTSTTSNVPILQSKNIEAAED